MYGICSDIIHLKDRDVRASHRWLRFSKIDDGALFRCDLLGGDFLLGLCSNKVLLVLVFVACLTN